MLASGEIDLEADVLVLPKQFTSLCAKPDTYEQPTGRISLDFTGELSIAGNGRKFALIVSAQRDFSDMRRYDSALREGVWRIEQAEPVGRKGNSWSTAIDNATFTFDEQSCAIEAAEPVKMLKVTFFPCAKQNFRIARFELK